MNQAACRHRQSALSIAMLDHKISRSSLSAVRDCLLLGEPAPHHETDVETRRPPALLSAMAGSQLKRLKASLREQSITGPQQSKKQKRKAALDGQARGDKKLQRGLVLEGIRQKFNPFDLKHAARGPKFDVTTNRPPTGDASRGIKGRPGQARAAGEEKVCSQQH